MTTRNMQLLYKLFMMLALAMVVSCGTNGSQSASTGDITAKLAWDASGKTTAKTVASAPVGVTTVRIIISAAGMTTIQKDFTAASGSGTIDGVLVGTGRNLTAQGLDGAGAVIYQGTTADLTVQAGQTTNAGAVTMAAVAAAKYGITGNFTSGGSALAGVTVSTSGGSVTTDASGNYTISGLVNDSYTVTPTKTGYTFTPASVAVTMNGANVTGKNFTATLTVVRGVLPTLAWDVQTSPIIDTYSLQLCFGSNSCDGIGGGVFRDVNLSDTITLSGFADGIRWTASSPVQQSSLNDLINQLNTVLTNVWSGTSTPSASVVTSVLNTALANGSSPSDVAMRARSGFATRGFPSGGTGGAVGSGYQCPTTKAVNDPVWIQSHGSYWAAADAHDSYVACLLTNTETKCHGFYAQETQYCDYALPACLAVVTNASDCP